MEFLIQISVFSPLVSETFHALFHLKMCQPPKHSTACEKKWLVSGVHCS